LLGLCAVIALLGLAGFAASGASAALISPLPMAGFVLVFPFCIAAMVGVSVAVSKMALPRLVRRLLSIGAWAVSVWSIATIARALCVTIAFAVADSIEQDSIPWMIVGFPNGTGAQALGAMSPETQRDVSVEFDSAAVEAISRGTRCFDLPVERTASGFERIRLPDGPLGVEHLVACPAVQILRR
jgi:hypothetical protein